MSRAIKSATGAAPTSGAKAIALSLLLGINLFNYIDRYVLAAVEPAIQRQFFPKDPKDAEFWMGMLATAFIVSYMITAPLFGWLADRTNRWMIVGLSVLVWSLATAASGMSQLVGGFVLLMITRLFVGIGEAGYGPSAPTLLSDYFSVSRRGIVLSCFYMAIPVGSALGFELGGLIEPHYGWPAAFYAVVGPGLLMGLCCFVMRDPPRGQSDCATRTAKLAGMKDYAQLLRNKSYVLNTLGMTAMTFAIGGISFWIPKYLVDVRKLGSLGEVNRMFGEILVVSGLIATLLGGLVGDLIRKFIPSSYFLISALAIFISCPFVLHMLHAEGKWVRIDLFLAIFFLFFNTGPSNTILANVTSPNVRSSAFAVNILIIHAFGDAVAPPILGKIGHGGPASWDRAFYLVVAMMALAGVLWLWGCLYLKRDTDAVLLEEGAKPDPVTG